MQTKHKSHDMISILVNTLNFSIFEVEYISSRAERTRLGYHHRFGDATLHRSAIP